MEHAFGTDKNPSGMTSVYGRRPGFRERYEGNAAEHLRMSIVTFMTTPKAMAQVLPPPLQPAAGLPAMVAVSLLDNTTFRGWDGKNHPYQEIGLWLPCQYKDIVGRTLFQAYLDGPGATYATIGGREVFGVPKLISTCQVVYDRDEVRATALHEGVLRISMHGRFTKEIPPEQSPMALTNTIFVKEIPNVYFTGYDVRKVIMQDWTELGKPTSMMMGEGEVQLGPPFDVLTIVAPGPAFQYFTDSPQAALNDGMRELADLLKT